MMSIFSPAYVAVLFLSFFPVEISENLRHNITRKSKTYKDTRISIASIEKKTYPSLRIVTSTVFILVLLPWASYSAQKHYYYLHVASFRIESNAMISAKKLRRYQVNTIIRKESVPNKGEWYRLYIGPYSTKQEAQLKSRELKQKRAIKYASIQKKGILSPIETETRAKAVLKKPEPAPAKVSPPVPPPPVIVEKKPPAKPLAIVPEKKPLTPKPAISAEPTKPPVQKPAPPKQPEKKKAETDAIAITAEKVERKKPEQPARIEKGRNVRGDKVALGYKHSFRRIETVVTSRERIDSNGTTTITAVSLTEDQKDNYPTRVHLDTAVLRYGLTNYLDIYGEVGVSYDDDEIGGLGPAYGGGLRLNIFQMAGTETSTGFYAALQGDYYRGEFEKEFTSTMGNKFKRETDWQDITGRLEFGITQYRFDAYIGGTYFNYQEDTDRQQLNNLSASINTRIFRDELEQKNDFGIYGGLSFRFTPHLMFNIEGRALDYKGVSGSVEYRF